MMTAVSNLKALQLHCLYPFSAFSVQPFFYTFILRFEEEKGVYMGGKGELI